MTTMTIGSFGGRETYALDLPLMIDRMGTAARESLLREATATGTEPVDVLESMIRAGLTEAAAAEGDPAPRFERVDDHLMVTAQSPEAPHA